MNPRKKCVKRGNAVYVKACAVKLLPRLEHPFRQVMREQGIRVKDLARILKMRPNNVSAGLTGGRAFSKNELAVIASYLGVEAPAKVGKRELDEIRRMVFEFPALLSEMRSRYAALRTERTEAKQIAAFERLRAGREKEKVVVPPAQRED